ncbi:M14 family metallopeptidase [Paramaledivibacter caminithermalis]|uniref:Gamma-D-glutamyl-(L)-meso-diaminopimelate peptidase I Metallo peptidase. MEROPS family M14C n=1 Tax=Paramaledivibacter caminithermalis (strain DSM 15212 / CIP 107654 / DViRD3) TaxID=1121301 RepID=A0A1M6M092_PARC5|nr:M14 family metallopeptidase [Paramaledivibacter caminithermalis]SHJ76901.1 gamma-D-glutamyl-{L}-meso-diaminopimelate peptidase I Metallo peptidase. MEROPS family M14C [Paramaledivibacter caminithermalis DSM 15212]
MKILKLGSQGTDVMEIQSLLKKIGYNPGPIDGSYGPRTKEAVIAFQKDNDLDADGIIGPQTYKILDILLRGYDTYYIQPGDTLWKIAKNYYTTVNKIVTANPSINPYQLQIGQRIIVPYGIDVVDTDIDYTYEIMERDIEGLKARYPFIEVGSAGESVLGRKLYYIKLGKGLNQVFYNGVHHSLEWITAPLLMKFIENFLKSYANGKNIRGYDLEKIWNQSSIYIIPMVNPDGVDLVLNGLSKDNPYYEELITWNNGSTDFSQVWQANNRGVDLNHNYPAKWQESKDAEIAMGIVGPSPTRYGGPFPLSEPETEAVTQFVRDHDFRLVLAYHTQGEVIFWKFDNLQPPEAKKIGELFSKVSGYRLGEVYGIASYAGMKDWFIQEYRRPGYTIEAGKGKNPLPLSQFSKIYNDNEELLLIASVV